MALKETAEVGHLPFIDRTLNDGAIEVLTSSCGKIETIQDIELICPGIPPDLKSEVLYIHKEIFGGSDFV